MHFTLHMVAIGSSCVHQSSECWGYVLHMVVGCSSTYCSSKHMRAGFTDDICKHGIAGSVLCRHGHQRVDSSMPPPVPWTCPHLLYGSICSVGSTVMWSVINAASRQADSGGLVEDTLMPSSQIDCSGVQSNPIAFQRCCTVTQDHLTSTELHAIR